MKIGVIPDCFRLPIREGIKKAAELKMDGIQPYATRGDLDPKNLTRTGRKDLRHFVESLGLKFSALVGDFGHGFTKPDKLDFVVSRTREVVDLAVDLGTDVVTTHIGVVPDNTDDPAWKNLCQALPEIGNYAASRGISLATETGPEPAVVLKKLLDTLANPGLKVNFDPANLVMVSDDPAPQAARTLAPYIVHTHAKDGRMLRDRYARKEAPWWQELPLGEGDVNFPEYLRVMKEIGYTGFFTIEREVGENPEADIIKARDFLRKMAQELCL
ncbi:MAG TPA: sugar phosphate isomerase/epimerase family protein [bacterium]|nr:sugar phosphate isomerase/epimerase family protein [bacterium]HOL66617.1 sugar phosphate isomerase/epimerase family protein [bacterium]HPP11817.1 sugar phosphate isomerase/epimerase family protein [bacterium]